MKLGGDVMKGDEVTILLDRIESVKTFLNKGCDVDKVIKDKNLSAARVNIKDNITKICVYEKGNLKQEIDVSIGLEEFKIDDDNKIVYINEEIRDLGRLYGLNLTVGDTVDVNKVRGLCKILVKVITAAINLNDYSWGFSRLIVGGNELFENDYRPNKIIITGFTSDDIVEDNQYDNLFKNKNIAPILYQEINNYSIV